MVVETIPSSDEALRTRTVTWENPMIGAAVALELNGLEYRTAIAAGTTPPPPIASLLGMDLISIEPGKAVFKLEIGEHLYNPIGSVHGGVLSTLLDSGLGCAVHSMLPVGVGYGTVD